MSRLLFGSILTIVGLFYLWLAYKSLEPGLSTGDWVSYMGVVIFLAPGIGAALAGLNLVRARRR
jgi:hypothetical protein